MSKVTGDTGSVTAYKEYQSMTLSHFLVVVAKDAIEKTHGAKINDWPSANYWAMVSSVKSSVRDDQIPDLMARYKITRLSDYPPPTKGN